MNIFGIGLPEMAVIAAIGLLVFGPKRLPELGKTLGRTLRGFQSASQEFEKEFRSAIATAEEIDASAAVSAPAAIAPGGITPEAMGSASAEEPEDAPVTPTAISAPSAAPAAEATPAAVAAADSAPRAEAATSTADPA